MGIAGKIINGVAVVQYEGVEYPVIKSNVDALDGYLHTGDKTYLLALATEKELARYDTTRER